jgi:hypothetical protein
MPIRKGRSERLVSATELAEMGLCEMRVVLNHRHGKRTTPVQRDDMKRGIAAHTRYLEQGRAAAGDRRCFVATCVFGADAEETQTLRMFRDVVLQPRWWGRVLIALYYRLAPSLCEVLDQSPSALVGVRWLLRRVVAGGRRALHARSRS